MMSAFIRKRPELRFEDLGEVGEAWQLPDGTVADR